MGPKGRKKRISVKKNKKETSVAHETGVECASIGRRGAKGRDAARIRTSGGGKEDVSFINLPRSKSQRRESGREKSGGLEAGQDEK